MNQPSAYTTGWAQLKHGGLLLTATQLDQFFAPGAAPLDSRHAEQLRRATTAFDGSRESLSRLLDYVLQELCGLPAQQWHKAQAIAPRWIVRSFTGASIKPRRLWLGVVSQEVVHPR